MRRQDGQKGFRCRAEPFIRASNHDPRRKSPGQPDRQNEPTKPSLLDKSELEGKRLDSFSNIRPLNSAALDSSQGSDFHQKHELTESTVDDHDKETKIDLDAALKAVNMALSGLEIGGKRQGTPTPPRPETAPGPSQTRSRPGFPPKVGFPRGAIRRFAKFVAPQQRHLSDQLNMQQQGVQLPYQQSRPRSSEFLMSSGELLNAQLTGILPNGLEMRSNYSESDMNALWANQGPDGWNLHQLQGLMTPQQGLTAQNGVGRHRSADFTNNPHLQKYMMENAIAELAVNRSDSWTSKIDVPKLGSVRGDSFSSKIEFPVNCDSFTSKMSCASVRDDSFTSQQPPFWPRTVEHQPPTSVSDALMDTAFSIPESIVQELECMAEGDMNREMLEIGLDHQMDPHAKSEQAILAAITRTLKTALEGGLCQDDLAADLNFLTIAVRRHLMDYQTFSSGAAEKFLLVGSTIPVVCRTAQFSSHVISLLKKFMDIISSGHPTLNNAAICVAPAEYVDSQKQIEARHILTQIYRTLTGEQDSDTSPQPNVLTSFDSADVHSSEAMALSSVATEPVPREISNPSSENTESLIFNDHVIRSA